ncbi:MAG: hypothetical protein K2K31_03080 [Clostridia bacterium]|nr:hypothetical protein [Clostridia bacterium]
MKKILYTILSILSIVYITFLIVNEINGSDIINIDLGGFAEIFDIIVKFGGVAIIFCFALVNFAGSPLKTVFFILLILAIVLYIVVLAVPDFFANMFAPKAFINLF